MSFHRLNCTIFVWFSFCFLYFSFLLYYFLLSFFFSFFFSSAFLYFIALLSFFHLFTIVSYLNPFRSLFLFNSNSFIFYFFILFLFYFSYLNPFRRRCAIWMAQVCQSNFSSPWTILALFAATAVLGLTVVQTYYVVNLKN